MASIPTGFLIKKAGKFDKIREFSRMFHNYGMADHSKNTRDYAARVVRRWTPATGAADVSKMRGAPMSYVDSKRLAGIDKAKAYHQKSKAYRTQADQQWKNVFGEPQTNVGRFGQWAARNTAGLAYDLPRALMFSPASKAGPLAYMGVGLGASAAGLYNPYDYTLPDIAGKALYLGTGAKKDAIHAATTGAYQGAEDMYNAYASAPIGTRLRMAGNPALMGHYGNQWTSNQKPVTGWDWFKSTALRGGGINEELLRRTIANETSRKAGEFLKTSSASALWKSVKRFPKSVQKGYRRMPVPLKAGVGLTGIAAFPAATGIAAYAEQKGLVNNTAYDQGYTSSQNELHKAYSKLPSWQRYMASLNPDAALRYAMYKSQGGSFNPGNTFHGISNSLSMPVQTMYTRPDGKEVYV